MHPLQKSKTRIKKQPIPKWFPEHWYRSSGNRHPERETGQDKVLQYKVSAKSKHEKIVSLHVLGTDEGKTTLNLRQETFERKKSIGWQPCCSLQHLTMCTNGLYHSIQISFTNHLLYLQSLSFEFFLEIFHCLLFKNYILLISAFRASSDLKDISTNIFRPGKCLHVNSLSPILLRDSVYTHEN